MKETVISKDALRALPEYSCSLPTGTTIGKRWRRNTGFGRQRGIGNWVIGEYVPCSIPGQTGIDWSWAVESPGNVHRGDLR